MSAVVFQRDIEYGTPLLVRALGATARLAAIVLLARVGGLSFGPFLLVHAWGVALGNVGLHFLARARLPAPAAPLAGMLGIALPLAALGLVQQGYAWADNAFVRGILGPAELGRYNAALRIFLWLAFFAAFATASALPWLARRHAAGGLGPAVARLAQPLFVGACVVAGLLAPWSERLLALAFGDDFASAGPSLRRLLATLVVLAPGAAFLTAVIAAGGAHAALRVALLALGVSLAANALLVPRAGIAGAALARLLAETSVTLASLAALRARGAFPAAAPLRWLAGPAALAATWLGSSALLAASSP
jgi:O-antigen/teichoic acid export membrane protein